MKLTFVSGIGPSLAEREAGANLRVMDDVRQFLVWDGDAKRRMLFSSTLSRHFPDAVEVVCADLADAILWAQALPPQEPSAVVIASGTQGNSGLAVVQALRMAHASVPIVFFGDPLHESDAVLAGATRCLDARAWLLVGSVVRELAVSRN